MESLAAYRKDPHPHHIDLNSVTDYWSPLTRVKARGFHRPSLSSSKHYLFAWRSSVIWGDFKGKEVK